MTAAVDLVVLGAGAWFLGTLTLLLALCAALVLFPAARESAAGVLAAVAAQLHAEHGMCPSCAEKDRRIAYWRAREERALDRLLEVRGVAPVATPPPARPSSVFSQVFQGLGVTEIRSTQQPGQGSALSGTADH